MRQNAGMPGKNVRRTYVENGYYHIYNRGAHKNDIFLDDQDFYFFQATLKRILKKFDPGNKVICFSVLSNHYHFLFQQKNARDISKIFHQLGVAYGLYLRSKYDHSGRVFQGPFRARHLRTPQDILGVREYILNNHIKAGLNSWPHYGFEL